jgi:hypothetical protein
MLCELNDEELKDIKNFLEDLIAEKQAEEKENGDKINRKAAGGENDA